jgi:hypothetical protein
VGPEVRSRLAVALGLLGAFGGLCAILGAYLDLLSVASPGYFPAWTDELVYVLEARSFAETGGLHGTFSYDGKVAPLFGAGTHGPMYGVVHGTVLAVFGQHPKVLLHEGFAILLGVLLIVARMGIDPIDRALLAASLLLHAVTPIYAMTYMQETLQLALTVPAAILFHRAAVRRTRGAVAAFLAAVAFAALFRPTYLAWTVGFFALARSRRELAAAAGLVAVSSALALGLFRLLYAPYPHGFLVNLGAEPSILAAFAGHVSANVERFLSSEAVDAAFYLWTKYLFLALLGAAIGIGIRRRSRALLGAGLIAIANLTLMLGVYDAFDWREHRFLAGTFHLVFVILAREKMRLVLGASVVGMAVLFPGALATSRQFARAHVEVSARVHPELQRKLAVLADRADGMVLLDPPLFADGRPELPLLPVVSRRGDPIRYTVSVRGGPVRCSFRLSSDAVLTPCR